LFLPDIVVKNKIDIFFSRRKRGFLSYLRAHWFVDGEHSHSVGGDCACLLILSPLTLGGAVLCIQSVSEKLRHVNENGDFEKAHEILALGLMALFLIIVFGFWVMFTVLFYLNDFRIWQKKNVILYVIDQLEREEETYNRSHNYLSESLRPLLLKKKLRRFFCCAVDRSREDTVIPLGDGVLDVNPQLVETDGSPATDAVEPRTLRPLLVSPISCASGAPAETNGDLNLSTSILMGSPVPPNNERMSTTSSQVPSLSTFRPHYTVASARMLASTPLESSPLSTIELLITGRTGSLASDEGSQSTVEVSDGHSSPNLLVGEVCRSSLASDEGSQNTIEVSDGHSSPNLLVGEHSLQGKCPKKKDCGPIIYQRMHVKAKRPLRMPASSSVGYTDEDRFAALRFHARDFTSKMLMTSATFALAALHSIIQCSVKKLCTEETAKLVGSSSPVKLHPSTICDDWQMPTQYRKCALCDQEIMLAQERFNPCKCEAVEVHTLCSINDEKWLSRKCIVCGEIWQKPFQPLSVYVKGSVTHSPYNCSKLCFICGKSSVSFNARPRHDAQMIRPCFCE
ncbi:hypothetical protein ANCCAN_10455, partial [Ancylostoma caninum]